MMKRSFAIAAAVLAAVAFSVQSADAGGRRHGDKRIAVVAIGTGLAATATFLAINDWRWKDWDARTISSAGAWALTTVGCAAVAPMVATVVVNRPLTQREGHVLAGSCVVPIIGGWLVNKAYRAHPEWEAQPVAMKVRGKMKKM
jgi:hypothetical protein